VGGLLLVLLLQVVVVRGLVQAADQVLEVISGVPLHFADSRSC
jgi:hypothetical protein